MPPATADVAAILPAGGSATRFGSDKLLAPLAGRPVIAWAVAAFLRRPEIAQVVIAARDEAAIRAALGEQAARVRFAPGGASRAHSVLNALRILPPAIAWVAIHDAARPLVDDAIITRTLEAARRHGAAGPALPVAATIKHAHGPLPTAVARTIPRQGLYALQTPQIASREIMLQAFERCPLPIEQITDDLQLLESAGHPTWLVEGEQRNLKITTPIDLLLAEILLQQAPTPAP